MAKYVDREALYRFLTEQKDEETGAYSRGRNRGLDIARSALHSNCVLPAADMERVTRCKDCYQSVVIGDVLHCTYWSKDTDENGYCHEGG